MKGGERGGYLRSLRYNSTLLDAMRVVFCRVIPVRYPGKGPAGAWIFEQ